MSLSYARFSVLAALGFLTHSASAQTAVWTHHNDNARTGANLTETILNASNVNVQQFGKLFSYPVDSEIYAQPLYVPDVAIPGKGVHNVVVVATMNDSVYAFDADSNAGANASPLWFVNFTNPAAGITAVPPGDVQQSGNFNIFGPIGILSTPVVDVSGGTVYAVARTKENGNYFFRLHALTLATGVERAGSPVNISATVPGTGYDAVGGMVTFNGFRENQRTALTLANGVVYIAFASLGDIDPYHGWVFGYSAATLQQVSVMNDTPNGTRGGLWQSGNGAAVDASGFVYFLSGNGDWDGLKNFGSSIVKLNPAGLTVADYFTPADYQNENQADYDLGASGPLLVPGANLIVGGGKEGILFVAPTGNMGHLQSGKTPQVHTLQAAAGELHGAPVYWNSPQGPLIYVWGAGSYFSAFHFNGSTFDNAPVMQSSFPAPNGNPGAALSLSANGSAPGSGVIWATLPVSADAETQDVAGVLRAFDADNLSHELWNSQSNAARDSLGLLSKFSPPTVANGKAYVSTFSNQLCVYGLFTPDFTIASTGSPQGVTPGSSAQYTVSVTPILGLTAPVQLSAQNLPLGATATFNPSAISGASSSTLTVATGKTTPLGTFAITVTGTAGAAVHSLTISLIVEAGGGTISGSMAIPASTQNLTALGTADWVHWGTHGAGLDRKNNVPAAISNFTEIGSAPVQYYSNNPFGFSWSDGQPDAAITSTATGVYVGGAGNGFQVSVPADTTLRTVTVYAGVYRAQASVTAALSDFSAASYTSTSLVNNSGATSAAYTISYRAATASQKLTITVVEAMPAVDPTGNITLQSVTLQATAAPVPDFTVSAAPSSVSLAAGGTASSVVTIGAINGFAMPVTLTLTGLPSNVTGTFQPATLGPGTSTLSLAATASALSGTYPVVIDAYSGALHHQTTLSVTVSGGATGGALAGTASVPQGVQNLTAIGNSDWVHWGLNGPSSVDRRAAGVPQIGNLTVIGNAGALSYSNNPFGFSWSNGTPTMTVAQTMTGLYVLGQNTGFQFTVPADATVRTLYVFAGVYKAQAKLTATLSDGSAPAFVDTSTVNLNGQLSVQYSLTYKAAAAGQTLTVSLIQTGAGPDSYSNVTLQAAGLQTAAAPSNLTGAVAIPTGTQDLTAAGSADWVHWIDTATLDRKAAVAAQITSYTTIGAAPVFAYGNNPFGFSWSDGMPTVASQYSSTGLYVLGQGNGFALSVPADTTWRTLTVYAGVYKTTGTFRAALSDGSSPAFVDSSITSANGSVSAAYTLHYRANSAAQTLSVSYTDAAPPIDAYSNVTLQAATLANQ